MFPKNLPELREVIYLRSDVPCLFCFDAFVGAPDFCVYPRAHFGAIWTASKAALTAPSMATVATGIPEGICTVDRRASTPSKALDFMQPPSVWAVCFRKGRDCPYSFLWRNSQ